MSAAATVAPGRLERALAAWLPAQRWYAGKGRPLSRVAVEHAAPFTDPSAGHGGEGLILVARAHYADGGEPEAYQVPVGLRPLPAEPGDVPLIAVLDDAMVFEALRDCDLVRDMVSLVAGEATRDTVSFRSEPAQPGFWPPDDRIPDSRLLGAEQSNTSVVIGDRYMMKFFRRLHPGTNPELELQRALRSRTNPHTAPLYGSVEGQLDGAPCTFAVLQTFLPETEDGWTAALARDPGFPGEARRMGRATAAVHADLAAAFGTRTAEAGELAGLSVAMLAQLDTAREAVPALAPHLDGVREAFVRVAALRGAVRLQRVHGDLHLGQVLRAPAGWLLSDFEGEPSVPIAERCAMHPPQRDVAGMLRSFDYAARHAADDGPGSGAVTAADPAAWAEACQDAFCRGYAEVAGEDPREEAELLRAYVLHKAVYETWYEARNRPGRVGVPLGAVARMTGSAASTVSTGSTGSTGSTAG